MDRNDGCVRHSRGGLTTKIHALVDADSSPIGIDLAPGQAHDNKMVEPMLKHIGKDAILLANRAYDSNALRDFAKEKRAWANIPAKQNGKEASVQLMGLSPA